MKAGISTAELVKAFSTSILTKTGIHDRPIGITNLRPVFETLGDIWAVRGDEFGPTGTAKDAIVPRLFKRVQSDMEKHPDWAIFDGVGPSNMRAIRHQAHRIGRHTIFVIAREFPRDKLPQHVAKWHDMEIVRAKGQAEKGYVRQMAKELQARDNIIYLGQAEFGAWAMAPVGNWVVRWLEENRVRPDAFVGCLASGTSLYGIGRIIAERFPGMETIVVTKHVTFSPSDLKDKKKVRAYAREMLKWYTTATPDLPITRTDAMVFPLHLYGPNFALLRLWAETGEPGIDRVIQVNREDTMRVQAQLQAAGYNWTDTTAFALVPAIRLAEEGKNVVVMVYGRSFN